MFESQNAVTGVKGEESEGKQTWSKRDFLMGKAPHTENSEIQTAPEVIKKKLRKLFL